MRLHLPLVLAMRFSLAWVMLWAFLDKTFGLGFATESDKSWLNGMSPTEGFLTHATQGPFQEIFQSLAGLAVVDWLFMLGLLLIGLSFFVGVGMRVAGISGATMMLLMWLAVLPPEHNPFMDEHIIYAFLFLAIGFSEAGDFYGFGKKWKKLSLVKKYRCLK